MKRTTLTPYCVSKPRDHTRLAPLLEVFNTPSVSRLGLCAIAQPYIYTNGSSHKDGAPLLLQRDPDDGSVTSLDVSTLDERSGAKTDAKTLTRELSVMRTPDTLREDMLQVTSRRLWLFAFPHLIILQADDILAEVLLIQKVSKDFDNSAWARAAYATLRFAPPQSNHATLKLLKAIPDALEVVQSFRPDATAKARAEGYDLGPFELADIQHTLAA